MLRRHFTQLMLCEAPGQHHIHASSVARFDRGAITHDNHRKPYAILLPTAAGAGFRRGLDCVDVARIQQASQQSNTFGRRNA